MAADGTFVESVWDYPRPPRVEASGETVVIEHAATTVVSTSRALRVLETSHPPTYYVPMADVTPGIVVPARSRRRSMCEFKGRAAYWDLVIGADTVHDVAWSYPSPPRAYASLVDHLAFYPGLLDVCTVDGEQVTAQEGDFYGGWITSRVKGPFKGPPGTRGW